MLKCLVGEHYEQLGKGVLASMYLYMTLDKPEYPPKEKNTTSYPYYLGLNRCSGCMLLSHGIVDLSELRKAFGGFHCRQLVNTNGS